MADNKTNKNTGASAKPTSANASKPAAKPAVHPTEKPSQPAKPTTRPATNASRPTSAPASKPAPTRTATARTSTEPAKPAARPAAVKQPVARTAPLTPPSRPDAKPAAKPTGAPTKTSTPTNAAKPTTATPTKPSAANASRSAQSEKPANRPAASAAKPAEKTERHAQTAKPTEKEKAKPATEKAVEPKKKNTAKPQVKSAKSSAKKSGSSGGVIAAIAKNKVKVIAVACAAAVVIIALVCGIVFGVRACNGSKGINVLPTKTVAIEKPIAGSSDLIGRVDADDVPNDAYRYEYSGTTAVGYHGELLSENVARVKPIETPMNEGLPKYPEFGKTLSVDTDEKIALIRESSYLTATGTANAGGGNYKWMDKDGMLYNGTTSAPEETGRQLYQHTASIGLYHGDVLDSEAAVSKRITMRPRGYNGYGVTGLYAPAGEVIKVQMSEADMVATGGIIIHIGQALYNGQANNIWEAKPMNRIPHLLNTMVVSKDTAVYDADTDTWTAYVGSFVGGPIYIRNEVATFTATITGGVEYEHFILGYTTEDEFNRLREKCSAPYFDLEVWSYGVLHSGSKIFARNYSYDDLYKAAVLWEKVSSVSTVGASQGIVFLYEPFVAAGAAVAFPGRRSVNCPEGWMSSSLNYNGIVTSGSWGNFHEYHHNFQGYGVGNGGEVTNNAMTLVSYALFTKISSARGISNFGGQGLGGWNGYTSATWALEQALKIARPDEDPSNGNQGLALYATLLHNFGAQNFIQAKIAGGGQSYAAYMKAWQNVTHNNMYYYFNDILQGTDISDDADPSYPMFVPVSCVYQTGRSYMYDGEKKYFETMQPYVIAHDKPFTIDLGRYSAPNGQYESGSIVIPDGFDYRVKSVTKPEYGSISVDGNNVVYMPDATAVGKTSGQIVVTLEIKKKNNAFKVADVDLVLEFELSRELNRATLERTTYTYSQDKMYTDAEAAYDAHFEGYETVKEKYDHSNPTQNCNTDIWYYNDTEENRAKYPDAPDSHFARDNTIDVLDGKLYCENEGKYRIYLRGRLNCALYYSLDGGKTYTLGTTIKDTAVPGNSHLFRENTYFDVTVDAHSFIYIREVLIVQTSPTVSYIGVGMRQWTQTMFTMVERHYDADGNEVESQQSGSWRYTETTYNDYNGNPVAVEVVRSDSAGAKYFKIVDGERVPSTLDEVTDLTTSKPIEPTLSGSQPYVNAYRCSYEFPDNSGFESDYFYIRSYNYNYVGDAEVVTDGVAQTYVAAQSNYVPWLNNAEFDIRNLFDGDPNTYIHSGQGNANMITESNPGIFTVDLGKELKANCVRLYPSHGGGTHPAAFPKNFVIEGSLDGEEYFEMGRWTDKSAPAEYDDFYFYDNAAYTFRYYRLTVTATRSGTNRLALADIKLINALRLTGNGSNHISPDNENLIFAGAWEAIPAQSSFGHVYAGASGATLTFEFTGTRVGFLSSSDPALGKSFEVYIDGERADSVALKADDGPTVVTYLCDEYELGKHRVELRCTGKANIDSIVVYR